VRKKRKKSRKKKDLGRRETDPDHKKETHKATDAGWENTESEGPCTTVHPPARVGVWVGNKYKVGDSNAISCSTSIYYETMVSSTGRLLDV